MWPASAGKEPVTPANQQNYAREGACWRHEEPPRNDTKRIAADLIALWSSRLRVWKERAVHGEEALL